MTKSEKEQILKRIEFEEKWLFDVLEEDHHISQNDIAIAMDGIRDAVRHMRGEEE